LSLREKDSAEALTWRLTKKKKKTPYRRQTTKQKNSMSEKERWFEVRTPGEGKGPSTGARGQNIYNRGKKGEKGSCVRGPEKRGERNWKLKEIVTLNLKKNADSFLEKDLDYPPSIGEENEDVKVRGEEFSRKKGLRKVRISKWRGKERGKAAKDRKKINFGSGQKRRPNGTIA